MVFAEDILTIKIPGSKSDQLQQGDKAVIAKLVVRHAWWQCLNAT